MPKAASKPAGPPRDIKPSGEFSEAKLAEVMVSMPKEWEPAPTAKPPRVAQWVIPGPGGDGEMLVFRFKGGAGGVEANLNRWKGQFQPPEGKTLDDIAQVKESTVGNLKITRLDISGKFVAAVRPGAKERRDDENFRMLAAIIEGEGDPFFLKGIGPKATMDIWAEHFDKGLASTKKGG